MTVRRFSAVLAAATMTLALVGCGQDDASRPDPEAGASPTPPEPASTGPALPDGPVLTLNHIEVTLPDDWRIEKGGQTAEPKDESDLSSIKVTDLAVAGDAYPLPRLVRLSMDVGRAFHFSRQPNVEVSGVEAYHLKGHLGEAIDADEYGISVDGYIVALRFEMYTLVPQKKRQQFIDSVLASVQWHNTDDFAQEGVPDADDESD